MHAACSGCTSATARAPAAAPPGPSSVHAPTCPPARHAAVPPAITQARCCHICTLPSGARVAHISSLRDTLQSMHKHT
jgi:hypothetical protein